MLTETRFVLPREGSVFLHIRLVGQRRARHQDPEIGVHFLEECFVTDASERAEARSDRGAERGLFDSARVRPLDVAAFVEELQGIRSKSTVKQHLAALRMLSIGW